MDSAHFDRLTRIVSIALSRRTTLAALASGVFGASCLARLNGVEARKKRKRKKKRKCKGSTKKCGKKCISRDECCGCAGNALCDAGVCQPCTVACPGGIPTVCGADLQAVLEDAGEGATVYVCPGTYQGNFALTKSVTVFGAGQGTDPASNTILDGNGTGRVLGIIHDEGLVALERLRITGGSADSGGGGILYLGTSLRLTDCTVSGNTANNAGGGIHAVTDTTLEMTRCTVRGNEGGFGGGILVDGNATLTDCLVEANSAEVGGGLAFIFGTATLAGNTQVRGNAAAQGGGIYVAVSSLVIAKTCRVTENSANAGEGGGVFNTDGSVTLQGADPSPIVVNNCHENCVGAVPKCAATPVTC